MEIIDFDGYCKPVTIPETKSLSLINLNFFKASEWKFPTSIQKLEIITDHFIFDKAFDASTVIETIYISVADDLVIKNPIKIKFLLEPDDDIIEKLGMDYYYIDDLFIVSNYE